MKSILHGKVSGALLAETGLRLLLLLVGLTIAHLGVTLFLLADLGADSFNVLVQGLCRVTESIWPTAAFLTHGRIHMGICFLIILILLLIDRSYIKIGTIVCMLAGGPIIDLFKRILGGVIQAEMPLAIRIFVNVLGCFILAYGMTVVIRSDAGTGPNDLVSVVISDKTKWKFSIVRVAVDVLFIAIGFALGGKVGIGTLICSFVVGPVAGLFLPINGKLVDRILASALHREKETVTIGK